MANEDASKLFVAGLPDSISEDVLRSLFEATGGTVVNVSLPKDRTTGRPRGFGFVTLASPEEASSARDALDGSIQAGRPISVRPFQSEPPRRDARGPGDAPASSGFAGAPSSPAEDRTLYVGNLPYDVSQQEIEALFADNGAGPVVRIHLPVGPDGRPRGFGFVTLATADAANSAIVALRAIEVRGRRLMINIANPRGAAPGGARTGAGPSMRPPRPRDDLGGGGYEPRSVPPGRFDGAPGPAPGGGGFDEGDPEGEGRRARAGGGGGGGAAAAAKKKKEKEKEKTKKRSERERGGGGSWQKWADWDDD